MIFAAKFMQPMSTMSQHSHCCIHAKFNLYHDAVTFAPIHLCLHIYATIHMQQLCSSIYATILKPIFTQHFCSSIQFMPQHFFLALAPQH